MSAISEKVIAIIRDQLHWEDAKVVREANIAADLYANSIEIVELLHRLQEEFDIDLSYKINLGFGTVGELIDYLEANSK